MKKFCFVLTVIFMFMFAVGCRCKCIIGRDPVKKFEASVVEITEGAFIVEPSPEYAESKSSDRISVSVKNLDLDIEINVGDTLEIYYEGEIQESYPATVTGVVDVRKIEAEKRN